MIQSVATLLGTTLSTTALLFGSPSTMAADNPFPGIDWRPRMGDRLVVDTRENMGYLIHRNGEYYAFPVATGKRTVVRYIGRVYNATTPTLSWVVQSREIKGDRITFGPTGRFLRLYEDKEHTPYGIHEHAREDGMFAEGPRFRSMGCIVVQRTMMDVIEYTFNLNEGRLDVVTQYGIDEPTAVAFAQKS